MNKVRLPAVCLSGNENNSGYIRKIKTVGLMITTVLFVACEFSHPAIAYQRPNHVTAIKVKLSIPLSSTDRLAFGDNRSNDDLFRVDRTGRIEWSKLIQCPCGIVANRDYVIFGDTFPVVSPVWHAGTTGLSAFGYMRNSWLLCCLNAKSGSENWTRPMTDSGVPIYIFKASYWSIRLDNPIPYFGKGVRARFAICLNSAKFGSTIKKWTLPFTKQTYNKIGHLQGEPYRLISVRDTPEKIDIHLAIIYPTSKSLVRFTYDKLSKVGLILQTQRASRNKSEYELTQKWESLPFGKTVEIGD